MAIIGPAVGYSAGGQLLLLHTDFLSPEPASLHQWVGAWWLGFVICGLASLAVAVPIATLPKKLPGMKEPSGDQVLHL